MQSPSEVIMVRSLGFGYDPETANSNAFQNKPLNDEAKKYCNLALQEFDKTVSKLESFGVKVTVFEEEEGSLSSKPDSIFPNNWFSTHDNGMIFLYPMMAKQRRLEKRHDIVEYLKENYKFKKTIDLSHLAEKNMFLEGTGSIVFDHINRMAYACKSNRTNIDLLKLVCDHLGYKYIEFTAVDQSGLPIYHTNVMMWIGTNVAAVCTDAIKIPEEQRKIVEHLESSGRDIIVLSFKEILGFAGNCLELVGRTDSEKQHLLLAVSKTALKSLDKKKIHILEKHLKIASIDVSNIEHVGGGGIRCMLAGVHLASKKDC